MLFLFSHLLPLSGIVAALLWWVLVHQAALYHYRSYGQIAEIPKDKFEPELRRRLNRLRRSGGVIWVIWILLLSVASQIPQINPIELTGLEAGDVAYITLMLTVVNVIGWMIVVLSNSVRRIELMDWIQENATDLGRRRLGQVDVTRTEPSPIGIDDNRQ